ncbi:hypothetical protein [Desulfopila sp. IMCC35008]|uniref:hypothetical protein n=1 Tax=Desulfopila sp. IMCC35008 TaxID=2653858 RepID=UPI0013D2CCBE|nr:hypothetical protein [Desulfopila sp. IMCC35008]
MLNFRNIYLLIFTSVASSLVSPLVFNSFAEYSGPEHLASIAWGNEEGQISKSQGGGSLGNYTVMFVISNNEYIIIPDQYNNKIMVLKNDGKFLNEITPRGITTEYLLDIWPGEIVLINNDQIISLTKSSLQKYNYTGELLKSEIASVGHFLNKTHDDKIIFELNDLFNVYDSDLNFVQTLKEEPKDENEITQKMIYSIDENDPSGVAISYEYNVGNEIVSLYEEYLDVQYYKLINAELFVVSNEENEESAHTYIHPGGFEEIDYEECNVIRVYNISSQLITALFLPCDFYEKEVILPENMVEYPGPLRVYSSPVFDSKGNVYVTEQFADYFNIYKWTYSK